MYYMIVIIFDFQHLLMNTFWFNHLHFRLYWFFTTFNWLLTFLNYRLLILRSIFILFSAFVVYVECSILSKVDIPVKNKRLVLIKHAFCFEISWKREKLFLWKLIIQNFLLFWQFGLFLVHILMMNIMMIKMIDFWDDFNYFNS